MRKPIIIGNWKMNNFSKDIDIFNTEVKKISKISIDSGIAIPSIYLKDAAKLFNNLNFIIASENVYFKNNGAYTGEISTEMLKDINVKWSILGHSERRQLFNETDEIINKKLLKCLKDNINVILCVGESLDEYNKKITKKIIDNQLKIALLNTKDFSNIQNLVIAYEPIWAIGTGKVATAEYAEEISSFIRDILSKYLNPEISQKIRIQYGGSVKPENIKSFLSKPNIDGALVGGASLKWESFNKLIQESSN